MIAQQITEHTTNTNGLNWQIKNLDIRINQKLKLLSRLKATSNSRTLHDASLSAQIALLERDVDNDIDHLVDMKRDASMCII